MSSKLYSMEKTSRVRQTNRRRLSAPLAPPLRTQHGVRSIPVRVGDTVMVVKGDRKMSEGRVTKVDTKRGKIYVEGITRQRLDGRTVQIPISPQNVMITRLKLDDEWRRGILERRGYRAELKGRTG